MAAQPDIALDRGLPASLDCERMVLGGVLMDGALFMQASAVLEPEDFSLEKHRRIFLRMGDLYGRGEPIDRVTVATELSKQGQLESVDGVSYLVSLDEGLPSLANYQSYVEIVKDHSTRRRLIFTCQNLIDRGLSAGEDTRDLVSAAGESFLRLGDDKHSDTMRTPLQIVERFDGGVNAFLDPSKRAKGVSTGLLKLDDMTAGLHDGDLIILAARPSFGKSAMACGIGQHVAAQDKPVAIFSLEMSEESLVNRMVCAEARVDLQKFRGGYLGSDERRRLANALSRVTRSPLFISDNSSIGLTDIHAKLRRLKSEHGLALAVVDYLQLMSIQGRSQNREEEVGKLSRGLKLIAKDLKVPMLVLSQLSRAPETRAGDHRPMLSDLRQSGSIEQDADLVAFIYREEVYKPDREDLKGLAELILAKQRNGPTGTVKLVFLKEFTKFENRVGDLDAE